MIFVQLYVIFKKQKGVYMIFVNHKVNFKNQKRPAQTIPPTRQLEKNFQKFS